MRHGSECRVAACVMKSRFDVVKSCQCTTNFTWSYHTFTNTFKYKHDKITSLTILIRKCSLKERQFQSKSTLHHSKIYDAYKKFVNGV